MILVVSHRNNEGQSLVDVLRDIAPSISHTLHRLG